jgi:hypothetical protein
VRQALQRISSLQDLRAAGRPELVPKAVGLGAHPGAVADAAIDGRHDAAKPVGALLHGLRQVADLRHVHARRDHSADAFR